MIFILRFILLLYTLVTDMHFDDMDLEVIAFCFFINVTKFIRFESF